MARITREEVLHVARLARLELTDDEVDALPGAALGILEAVSKVSELDLTDVPPTAHPLEIANAWAEDEPRPCLPLDEVFANAPDRDGRPLPDAARMIGGSGQCHRHSSADRGGGEATLLDATARSRASELFAAYLAAIGERDPELHAYLYVCDDEPGGDGHPDRDQGRDRDEGRPDDGRLEDPRELRPGLRRDGRRALQGARPAAARQDEHRRVRDGLVDRELGVRPDAQPVGSRRASPAARAAAAPRRSPAGSRRGRSARTPAARSSSRRRSAATSACGRPTAPSRATASSRSRRRSTRSGRSRRTCATARCSTRSSRAATTTTRRPSMCRPVELPAARGPEGRAHRRAEGDERGRGDRAGRARQRCSKAIELAESLGAEVGECSLPRSVEYGRRLLLPDRARGGLVEPGALRRCALRPAQRRRRLPRDGDEARATTASATSRSGGS